MRHALNGFSLILGTPRLWPFIWKPMLTGALVFAGVVVAGWLIIAPAIARVLERWDLGIGIGGAVGTLLYFAALFLFSGTLYLGLVGILSSFLWDRLSLEVEREIHGSAPESKLSFVAIAGDAIARGLFSFVIALLAFGCGWTFLGIPAILFAGWLGLYDYTAPAFLRRGVAFGRQSQLAFGCRGWLGFAFVSGLLTLIPLVNVLSLPCLVAGGTLMVGESEGARSEQRSQ